MRTTLLIFALSLLISGCGGNSNSDNTGQENPSLNSVEPLNYSLPHVGNQLVVKLKSGSSSISSIMTIGVSGLQSISEANLHLIDLDGMSTDEAFQILSANPDVELIQLNYKYSITWDDRITEEPLFENQSYLHDNPYDTDLDLEAARQLAIANNDVIVAVLDTGCDPDHEDGGDFVQGYDFVNNTADVIDDHGHGTFCAGQIAAQVNDIGAGGIAANLFSYHSRGIKIMPVKFLDASGSGTCWNAARAIRFAVDNAAKVLSCSFGGRCDGYAVQDAVIYAQNMGAVIVAAAGNSGLDADASSANMIYPMGYPYDHILSLGAIERDGTMASYSTYGRVSVDAVGIGTNAFSLLPVDSYGYMTGTSMVAPQGSAVAAMMLAMNAHLTNVEVVDIIKNSVVQDPYLNSFVATAGRLNAVNALQNTPNTGVPPIIEIDMPNAYQVFESNELVDLVAVASDFEDDASDLAFFWESSIDGPLGESAILDNVLLSDGIQNLTVTVTDSDGNVEEKTITVYVNLNPPNVAIVNNRPDINPSSLSFIDLISQVDDVEDGSLVSIVRWRSDVDGLLGNGLSFAGTLTPEFHEITCTAVDSDGLVAETSMQVDVSEYQIAINADTTTAVVLPESTAYAAFDVQAGIAYKVPFRSSDRCRVFVSEYPNIARADSYFIKEIYADQDTLAFMAPFTGQLYVFVDDYLGHGLEIELLAVSESVSVDPLPDSILIDVGVPSETYLLSTSEMIRFHVWLEAGSLYEINVDGARNPNPFYSSQRLVDTYFSANPAINDFNYDIFDVFSNDEMQIRPANSGYKFIAIKDHDNAEGSSFHITVSRVE